MPRKKRNAPPPEVESMDMFPEDDGGPLPHEPAPQSEMPPTSPRPPVSELPDLGALCEQAERPGFGRFEYASLRVVDQPHKLRHGVTPKLVEAGGEQTITYRDFPFPHFDIQPGGVQIPLHNVASAIPMGASIANKIAKTTEARRAARIAAQTERTARATKAVA